MDTKLFIRELWIHGPEILNSNYHSFYETCGSNAESLTDPDTFCTISDETARWLIKDERSLVPSYSVPRHLST